jgi:hypothetical protein
MPARNLEDALFSSWIPYMPQHTKLTTGEINLLSLPPAYTKGLRQTKSFTMPGSLHVDDFITTFDFDFAFLSEFYCLYILVSVHYVFYVVR